MKKLTVLDYNKLVANSSILSGDDYGPKVLKLSTGYFAKFFRVKKILSSAWIYPYSKRFANNVAKLEKLNILTIKAFDTYKVKHKKRDMVLYEPIDGVMIRKAFELCSDKKKLVIFLAHFWATLHERGVFFRAVHFGNIILTENKDLGLIDVDDMFFQKKALSLSKRIRNIKHLLRYKEDRKIISQHGISFFFEAYNEKAKLSKQKIDKMIFKAESLL